MWLRETYRMSILETSTADNISMYMEDLEMFEYFFNCVILVFVAIIL